MPTFLNRSQDLKIFHTGFSSAYISVTCFTDSHRGHILRFNLGIIRSLVYPECPSSGL